MKERKDFLDSLETINANGAETIKNSAIEAAKEMGVSNILILVHNSQGVLLSAQALGEVSQMNAAIAFGKAKTVLATQRSTSFQRSRMEQTGLQREDYCEKLGTLITGGVAIFKEANSEGKPKSFLGSVAIAGAYPAENDEKIGITALTRLGLYTDVSIN